MHHAGNDQSQAYRYQTEKENQFERIDNGFEEDGNLKHCLVVFQANPFHDPDTVPTEKRVFEAHEEGDQHK